MMNIATIRITYREELIMTNDSTLSITVGGNHLTRNQSFEDYMVVQIGWLWISTYKQHHSRQQAIQSAVHSGSRYPSNKIANRDAEMRWEVYCDERRNNTRSKGGNDNDDHLIIGKLITVGNECYNIILDP
jgi:hypothetical protein